MKREKYNTESKRIILDKIKKINGNFTAKDIKKELDNVGLTTIYRFLEELVESGILKRYYNDSNIANYEYLCECEEENHFYLKCLKCGMTKHIDCNCINSFSNHILKEHDFNIENNNLFITGICSKCKENL